MKHRRSRIRIALATGAVLLAAPAAAHAQSADIEGVWTFSGGQVAVQGQPDGSFTGTVIRTTTLANCPHPVGERMWIGVVRQPDGSYWGGHQWFRNGSCEPIPTRGRTAHRVLARPDGTRFLRVCFSRPETPDVQPKIAPDGSNTDTNDECRDSDLVSPLPARAPSVTSIATLPRQGSRRCLSRRSFRIRLKEPRGDALASASVFVNGRRVATRRGARLTAPINLRGLPRGRYGVRITAKTVLGRTISGTRRYRTCSPRRRRSNSSPV
jgi:hypothetical protein